MFLPPPQSPRTPDPILGLPIDVDGIRFRLQHLSKKLAPRDHRIHVCFHDVNPQAEGVEIRIGGGNHHYFAGQWTCGNVWVCPVCADRKGRLNQSLINKAYGWAEQKQYHRLLLTLTAGFEGWTRLEQRRKDFRAAKTLLTRCKSWKELAKHLKGSITKTDVPFSRAWGWLPHEHISLFINAESLDEAVQLVHAVKLDWVKCLKKCNLMWFGASAKVTMSDQDAAKYFTKDSDVINNHGGQSLQPFDVLRRAGCAGAGYDWARQAWSEFVNDIKDLRQLRFSNDLKKDCGIIEENEENQEDEEHHMYRIAGTIDRATWTQISRRNKEVNGALFGAILRNCKELGFNYIWEWLYNEHSILPPLRN